MVNVRFGKPRKLEIVAEETGTFPIPADIGNRTLEVNVRDDGSDDEAKLVARDHHNRLTSVDFRRGPSSTTIDRVIALEYDALNRKVARRV